MPGDDRLSASLQESVLTALCFETDETNKVLPIITPELFEGVYYDVANRVLDYRFRQGQAPGKAHIDDLFDDILSNVGHKQYETYNRLFIGMLEQYNNGFDCLYVTSRVAEFARRQQIKKGVIQAAERFNQGGDDLIPDLERILLDTVNTHTKSLDLGAFLNDRDRALQFLDKNESDYCLTGIKELDRGGIYPKKKELFLFVAPYKRGKTWFLVHLAKMALVQGWRVAFASLELSEEQMCERCLQAYYSISRRNESFIRTKLLKDELGRLIDVEPEQYKAKMAFDNERTRQSLQFRMRSPREKLGNLVVKEFSSAQTTLRDFDLWLDSLEYVHSFAPDLFMVDQPLAMNLGRPAERRQNLSAIGFGLKGMATKRNMAVVAPHQVNRVGAVAKRVRTIHTAEDISLIHTCDVAITYSQTDAEYKLGLARLFVDSVRSEAARFTVLISQSYKSGQFVIDSCPMGDSYEDLVNAKATQVTDDDRIVVSDVTDDDDSTC